MQSLSGKSFATVSAAGTVAGIFDHLIQYGFAHDHNEQHLAVTVACDKSRTISFRRARVTATGRGFYLYAAARKVPMTDAAQCEEHVAFGLDVVCLICLWTMHIEPLFVDLPRRGSLKNVSGLWPRRSPPFADVVLGWSSGPFAAHVDTLCEALELRARSL